jgi:predicted S18 family serine protease
MSSRARLLCTLLIVIVSVACGGEPPQKEIQQARTAIEAAVAAGADRWATEELTAAQDALKQADEAVNDRDYRLALNHALDSLERAQNAAREATAKKNQAKEQADRGIGTATTTIASTRTKLKAAEGHAPAKTLTAAHTALTTAEERVQEARAAYTRDDWSAAGAAAAAAMQALTTVNTDLDAYAPPAARRKR